MSSAGSKCAQCLKDGGKKCSRCSSVFYCSRECQEAHFPKHKAECKKLSSQSSPASPARGISIPIVSDAPQALAKLTALKENQQKAIANQDLKGAIDFGKQALALALQLKGPALNFELAHLYFTLSGLSLQANKLDDAEEYGAEAMKHSEMDLKAAADNPKALELHSHILCGEAQRKIALGKLESAEKPALKALETVEEIFGSEDPRLVKALRCCAGVRELQRNDEAACMYLKRAYHCVFNAFGYFNADTQMHLQTYFAMLMKKNDFAEALAVAEDHYQNVEQLAGPQHPMTAECGSRFAQVLCRLGRLEEAEDLATTALDIKQKALGDDHIALVPQLSTIASIREAKMLFDETTEKLLRKALSILRHSEPPNSPNIRDIMLRLTRLAKLQKSGGKESSQLDDDDDMVEFNKPGANQLEKAHFLMTKANQSFQEEKFGTAEVYLTEATKIFAEHLGKDHQATKIAYQNLAVTRNKNLMHLWDEVVREEVDKARAKQIAGENGELSLSGGEIFC